MYRLRPHGLEVLLAHPGGPFWRRRDLGAWGLPKGEIDAREEPLAAACREFAEETGFAAAPPFTPLGEVRQKGGKQVVAWAFQGDADPGRLKCNTFEMEWPPRSGRQQAFPEIDRVGWFALDEARQRILPAQAPFLERLEQLLLPRAAP